MTTEVKLENEHYDLAKVPSAITHLPAHEGGGLLDQQITMALTYPRSVKRFRDEALQLSTLTEEIAADCHFALPRSGKTIEGPSIRFAEIIASAWRNCRYGARVVSEEDKFITVQGVFYDVERNAYGTSEIKRSIVTREGKRYGNDMIAQTANAACSIALRNAILRGVPKAMWADIYDQTRTVAIGNVQTLANRRAEALKVFVGYGIDKQKIFQYLGIKGEEDITLEHLSTLRGILTSIKEGDVTPENAFVAQAEHSTHDRLAEVREKLSAKGTQP